MRVLILLLTLCLSLPPVGVAAEETGPRERIAIIGTGNVGAALGQRWGTLGHEIIYGSRDPGAARLAELVAASGPAARAATPAAAAASADIVVLAVPWTVAEEALVSLGDLAGRVIIDPINPSRFVDGRVELGHPGLAERLASLAPEASLVKALNTTSYRNMLEPPATDPITVPLAGDDEQAVTRVARLVAELGLLPRAVGPLYNARYLEAMGNLYIYVNVFQRPEPRLEYRF